MTSSELTLVVRRTIAAPPGRLFAAWTQPEQLLKWWGPRDVTCTHAEVDLRVAGRFRLANRFPDGRIVWIAGAFQAIEPPRRLVYSWGIEPAEAAERVTVRFEAREGATEVIVTHERIASATLYDGHAAGWAGCLDRLAARTAD